ncbi:MarR family transcriptional regulator [Clostridium sp. SM-530-WT-3G]|uniref:MarR family winged helix-turn-helix transcriptional regulator n=1 Tax=Clostridium sp. SM-530-WT-3G TaxID=2725303 RepID=UPI00145D0BAC|nr:MarR family transcriptional regulator [Clostridium sp. SM-530-WT-3G]NME83546.1 MarR family transcriptional regulator [Clostridium sp. SM-530-WT-3G]
MSYSNLNEVSNNIINFIFNIQCVFTESDFLKKLSDKSNCSCPNLPPSHIKVIFYLTKYKSPSISEIAKSLKISKSNMTPIIDKLIEEDLVTRYPDPNDRRVLRIDLTPKSKNLLDYIYKMAMNVISDKISCLCDDDLIKIDKSLKDITDIFKKLNL